MKSNRLVTFALLGIFIGIHFALPSHRYIVRSDGAQQSESQREQPTNTPAFVERGIYDTDPHHLWNRLYRSLFIRIASDGQEYGYDELDPLLWSDTKRLLSGPSHQQAIHLLDEFLSANAEQLIADPLKRAFLQHDLWAVFDWSTQRPDEPSPQKRELQIRLAQIIRRLALPKEQIEKLPNNYADAVASKAFAGSYDPDRPQVTFLPSDLFQPEGPWAPLSVIGGEPVAPGHVSNFSGRSAFRVFMRLPGGRQATLAYIKKLLDFPHPWIQHPQDYDRMLPNPDLPQFPVGTQLALVRQMILIDNQGDVTPTTLTEQVKIRVHRAIPSKILEVVRVYLNEAKTSLDVSEFKLSRERFLLGKSGGLRAVTPDEREFPLFQSKGIDPFESSSERGSPGRQILSSCAHCHFRPGIHSVLSRERRRLTAAWDIKYEASNAVSWKHSRYDW